MRELFDEAAGNGGLDPSERARDGMRVPQRKRFYKDVAIVDAPEGFAVTLDGKPVRTPGGKALAAPRRVIAEALAAEWDAQREIINPMAMPLTRLANSIIEGVTGRVGEVADDIAKYFESDLLFYRADHPQALVAREGEAWDPILDWAAQTLGARFVLAEGIVHARQPGHALAAAHAALPDEPWTVGALHVATTLTGSALLALALWHGVRDAPEVWAAAHVDEDWNLERWGSDEAVLTRRAARFRELEAAALVLRAMSGR
jgi:chaperone required for assembly of F1-ATPase